MDTEIKRAMPADVDEVEEFIQQLGEQAVAAYHAGQQTKAIGDFVGGLEWRISEAVGCRFIHELEGVQQRAQDAFDAAMAE